MPRRLLALLLGACLATAAAATSLIQLDTPALVRGSHDIVIGRVVSQRSHWNPGHSRILTDIVVAVDETLKGTTDAGGTITLTQLGGVVDGARLAVAGSPTFAPGEEALLFVWRDPDGR